MGHLIFPKGSCSSEKENLMLAHSFIHWRGGSAVESLDSGLRQSGGVAQLHRSLSACATPDQGPPILPLVPHPGCSEDPGEMLP